MLKKYIGIELHIVNRKGKISSISADMSCQRGYAKLQGLAGGIDEVMKEAGVKCLLLKGLSLAEYYPRPDSRKFLDIDLYAPGAGFGRCAGVYSYRNGRFEA